MTRSRRRSWRASSSAAPCSALVQPPARPGSAAPKAAARWAARAASEPSTLSARYHATGASLSSAHAASRVVLPDPAGATTSVRRWLPELRDELVEPLPGEPAHARSAHLGRDHPIRRDAPAAITRPAPIRRSRPHVALGTPHRPPIGPLPPRTCILARPGSRVQPVVRRHGSWPGRLGGARWQQPRSGRSVRAAPLRGGVRLSPGAIEGRAGAPAAPPGWASWTLASSSRRSGRCEIATNSRSKAVRSADGAHDEHGRPVTQLVEDPDVERRRLRTAAASLHPARSRRVRPAGSGRSPPRWPRAGRPLLRATRGAWSRAWVPSRPGWSSARRGSAHGRRRGPASRADDWFGRASGHLHQRIVADPGRALDGRSDRIASPKVTGTTRTEYRHGAMHAPSRPSPLVDRPPARAPSPSSSRPAAGPEAREARPQATPAPAASPSPRRASPTPGATIDREGAIARVLAQDPRFSGIGPLDPDLIGQSAWYEVSPGIGRLARRRHAWDGETARQAASAVTPGPTMSTRPGP